MARKSPEPEEWFPPKRYGYGAGLPVTWRGWLVTLVYLLVVVGLAWWTRRGGETWLVIGGIMLATAVFVPIVRRHTRGGWRWRGGERD